MYKVIVLIVMVLMLVGCSSTKPLTGGHSKVDGNKVEMVQSENPASVSKQKTEHMKTFTIVKGTVITNGSMVTTLIEDLPVTELTKTETELGPAQEDLTREIGAKLSGMKPIMFFGMALVAIGIFGLTPWGRPFIASTSTCIILMVAGAGIMVLPSIIVGNELLILLGCGGVGLGYFLIHRYGKKDGQLQAYKSWYDDNKDGKVDEGEVR